MNLHAYMDSMAGEQKNGERLERPLTETGWAYLQNLAGSIMKEFPPEHFQPDQLTNLDPHAWTVESYNAAVEFVYPFVQDNKNLTAEYEKKMFDICR